jgi:16S rRNA G966 N2-methylase RsmD
MVKTHEIEAWLKMVNASHSQLLWELINGETLVDDFRSMVVCHADKVRQKDPQAAELHDLIFEAPPYEQEWLEQNILNTTKESFHP